MKRKRRTLMSFDLAVVRKVKRRAKQVVAELERVEKFLMKLERKAAGRAGSPEERELAAEMYRSAAEFRAEQREKGGVP